MKSPSPSAGLAPPPTSNAQSRTLLLFTIHDTSLEWNEASADESVRACFEYVDAFALDRIAWYRKKKTALQWGSRFARLVAVILAVIGAICPLVEGLVTGPYVSKLGYVFLAGAGGVMLF